MSDHVESYLRVAYIVGIRYIGLLATHFNRHMKLMCGDQNPSNSLIYFVTLFSGEAAKGLDDKKSNGTDQTEEVVMVQGWLLCHWGTIFATPIDLQETCQ